MIESLSQIQFSEDHPGALPEKGEILSRVTGSPVKRNQVSVDQAGIWVEPRKAMTFVPGMNMGENHCLFYFIKFN